MEVSMKRILTTIVLLAFLLSSCAWAPVASQSMSSSQTSGKAVLLFGIGMHIEPQGTTHQGFSRNKGDYNNLDYFKKGVEAIRAVADIVAGHNGRMTIQAQSPFNDVVIASHDLVLSDLAKAGHEMALHFHEDAHLGKNSSSLSVNRWCEVMKEEIALIKQASGVSTIRYWSGGNLYTDLFAAAECAGLDVNSDWKNPQTQSTDASMIGIHPWRPAGGTNGSDFNLISTHDPAGAVIFLPEGQYDRGNFASMRRSKNSGGDQAYFDYLKQSLLASVAAAEAGKVNVFHFTVHPGEFRGSPAHPFEVIDQFLKNVVDPLVTEGKVQWATFSQMADAYQAWEVAHPGQDMRK
jgi:hypothetical protein